MKLDIPNGIQGGPSPKKAPSGGPYYAQIPKDLLTDSEVSFGAKCQYAAYHSFSKQKNLSDSCQTFVSQSKLAKFLNITKRQVVRNQKELFEQGWIQVKKRGGTSTNIITLLSNKQTQKQDDDNES